MILGTIFCRAYGKGIHDKNIQLLNEKPLLAYTIETALNCRMLDDLIVSTNSEDVAKVAIQHRARVPFMLPEQLVTNKTSDWSLLLHIVESYEKQFGKEISYIVDMNVNVPLKTAADIDGAVKLALQYPETDVVITGYASERNPYFNMMELTDKGYAEMIKRTDESSVPPQNIPKVFSLSDAAFVIKKSALYNYSHWSHGLCRIYEIPHARALNMDEEMDFELIQGRLNRHQTF